MALAKSSAKAGILHVGLELPGDRRPPRRRRPPRSCHHRVVGIMRGEPGGVLGLERGEHLLLGPLHVRLGRGELGRREDRLLLMARDPVAGEQGDGQRHEGGDQ